eukprot:6213419-Pleurochrysis_carterae.AAC.2
MNVWAHERPHHAIAACARRGSVDRMMEDARSPQQEAEPNASITDCGIARRLRFAFRTMFTAPSRKPRWGET